MPDRPIIFSGPMVRAILDGRKTQTRRIIKVAAGSYIENIENVRLWATTDGCAYGDAKLPYAIGDTLWVREAWRTCASYDDLRPSQMGGEEPVKYLTDGWEDWHGWPRDHPIDGRYRQRQFMPRWASRLTLTITDVRAQWVQTITPEDAVAEGLKHWRDGAGEDWWEAEGVHDATSGDPVYAFSRLWDSLNAKRGFGWDADPWVAAYTFTVARRNIDHPNGVF